MNQSSNDDGIIYFTKLHWIIFTAPVLVLGGGLFLYFYLDVLQPVAPFLLLIAFLWMFMTWISYHFSSVTLKKKQVILQTGVIVRQTVNIPLTKIETIDIRQSILGSLLHYGSLMVTGTGGTRYFIHYLRRPLTCRRQIEQLL